jgi:hypothetical protein
MNPQQRILVVRRAGDGLVQIAAVTDVAANIQLAQSFGVQIDGRLETRPGRAVRSVVEQLHRRYRRAGIDGGPWFAVDFWDARDAVAEYDLDTGERIAAHALGLNDTVWVEGTGYGKVTGFTSCGRVEVTHLRTKLASLVVCAPKNLVARVA